MQATGGRRRERLRRLGRVGGHLAPHLNAMLREGLWRDYEDTLRRLLRGDFADLSEAQRRERAEQVIRLSAVAAMAMAAAPVPLLDLPVLLAMVSGIARIYGRRSGRAVYFQLLAALGGGLFLRHVWRYLPTIGPLPHLSRVYGATWALGQAATVYFAAVPPPERETLRAEFERTLEARSAEEEAHLQAIALEKRLGELQNLRDRQLITEAEFQAKRAELLDSL